LISGEQLDAAMPALQSHHILNLAGIIVPSYDLTRLAHGRAFVISGLDNLDPGIDFQPSWLENALGHVPYL